MVHVLQLGLMYLLESVSELILCHLEATEAHTVSKHVPVSCQSYDCLVINS